MSRPLTASALALLDLADYIEKLPHVRDDEAFGRPGPQFDMSAFGSMWDCGFVGCIAGHALNRAGISVLSLLDLDNFNTGAVVTRAAEVLGLSEELAEELFLPREGNIGLLEDVLPSEAAAVLRHLAYEGVVDWSKEVRPLDDASAAITKATKE